MRVCDAYNQKLAESIAGISGYLAIWIGKCAVPTKLKFEPLCSIVKGRHHAWLLISSLQIAKCVA